MNNFMLEEDYTNQESELDDAENINGDENTINEEDSKESEQNEAAIQAKLDQDIFDERQREQEQADQEKAAKDALEGVIKSEVKKTIWRVVLPYIIAALPYILIALLILIIIGFFYYLITDPCAASQFIGTWWATALGKICQLTSS